MIPICNGTKYLIVTLARVSSLRLHQSNRVLGYPTYCYGEWNKDIRCSRIVVSKLSWNVYNIFPSQRLNSLIYELNLPRFRKSSPNRRIINLLNKRQRPSYRNAKVSGDNDAWRPLLIVSPKKETF